MITFSILYNVNKQKQAQVEQSLVITCESNGYLTYYKLQLWSQHQGAPSWASEEGR